ncbi:MAG: hypothetical protein JWQ42_479 [Edaphobacter sp.]|nr:hypothetical protein [Edaphobacter sp.]
MTSKMTRKICRHIKTNGRRCGSPSLNRNELCYFHARLFERERVLRQPLPPALFPGNPASPLPAQLTEIDLPTLEDAESIQVSISLLVSALALNRIDSKRAAVLLYGLQLASTNARSIITEPFAEAIVRSIVESPHGTDFATDTEDTEADPQTSEPAGAQ